MKHVLLYVFYGDGNLTFGTQEAHFFLKVDKLN